MTDDKLEAGIARGARAKELLGSELLKEVFAQIGRASCRERV